MSGPSLPPRLAAVVSLVRPGARVADVGTDHGRVPAFLAVSGAASYIIASDVRPGPLRAAMRTAEEKGVADKIEFRLTDGLCGMSGDAIDTVLLAGMGGETISEILAASPWSTERGVKLVLQPQSKLPELYDFLTERGVFVTDALLARDAGRLYLIFSAENRAGTPPTEAEKYVPVALFNKRDPLLADYLAGVTARLKRIEDGVLRSGGTPETGGLLRELLKMKTEAEKWQA